MSETGCGVTEGCSVGGDDGTSIGECDRVSFVSRFSGFDEEGVGIGEKSRINRWNSSGIDEVTKFGEGSFFGIGDSNSCSSCCRGTIGIEFVGDIVYGYRISIIRISRVGEASFGFGLSSVSWVGEEESDG